LISISYDFHTLDTGASTPFNFEDHPVGGNLIYLYSTDPGTGNIILKSTRRYAKKLHSYYSFMGKAPLLLGCETLDGGVVHGHNGP
jgi:hypothetical protein